MSKDTFGDWLRDGRTVYELTDRRVNRWSALVQDAHTPEAELVEIARLIAAAPDLLAALIAMHEAFGPSPDGYALGYEVAADTLARNAIRKATGEAA